jgi:hypothetical protein
MGYSHKECFSCYFGGNGCNLQLKLVISDEDEANDNIYNKNVDAHPICFGCIYKLSRLSHLRFNNAISYIETNKVELQECVLCDTFKICITQITVCDECKKSFEGKDFGDDDSEDDDSEDDESEADDDKAFTNDDKELTKDEEAEFYKLKTTLCFGCIDQIQCVKYKWHPRNKDILLSYIKRRFVNVNQCECSKCRKFRWGCTTR